MTIPVSHTQGLETSLVTLRGALADTAFLLGTRGSTAAEGERRDLAAQLDDYILPRAARLDAPLLAVVGGSTGAGKSTLVNSILGADVTRASAIRPTTRRPVLVVSPDDASWFESSAILPGLARVHGSADGDSHSELALAPSPAVPAGLALLDAPDIDSVEGANRRLAAQLMAAADLWLFVTTAARYADAVPWAMLDDAAARNIVVGVVLNRVPVGVGSEVREDLVKRLREHGLEQAPLFVVAEHVDESGHIPEADIAAIRGWLQGLVRDNAARESVARQTLMGAVHAMIDSCQGVAAEADAQAQAAQSLSAAVRRAREETEHDVEAAIADGRLLRGEVLLRWNDVVGTGAVMRVLEDKVSSLRDRITSWFKGSAQERAADVGKSVEDSLADTLVGVVHAAMASVEEAWRAAEWGIAPAADAASHRPTDEELAARARVRVARWRQELAQVIENEGAEKKLAARGLSIGVNVLGAAAMIVVFASTAGLTGAEAAIAGGTAVAAERILEAVFGDDAVRKMTKDGREALMDSAREFVDQNLAAYQSVSDELVQHLPGGDALRAALEAVAAEGEK